MFNLLQGLIKYIRDTLPARCSKSFEKQFRCASERKIQDIKATFQGEAARVFNDLPVDIRNSNNLESVAEIVSLISETKQ